MSDDAEVIPPAAGGLAPDAADMGEIAKKQWSEALQAFGKTTTAMSSATPFMPGGVPFTMPFPAPFMLPGLMQYGLNPFFHAAAAYGAEQDATASKPDANQGGSKSENINRVEEGSAPPPTAALKRRPSRAASLPQKKVKPAEQGIAVRSQSQAALALLATAAGDAFPSSSADLPEPPPSLKTEETLPATGAPTNTAAGGAVSQGGEAGKGGSVNLPTRKMSIDVSLDAGDDDFALVNTAGLDERELKKLRRKQSNRESARRSRLKKQEECDTLQRENRELRDEIEQLKNDKIELSAQVAILNARLSMAGVLGAMQQQQQPPPSSPPAAMVAAMAAAAAAAAKAGGTLPQPSPNLPSVPAAANKAEDDDDEKNES